VYDLRGKRFITLGADGRVRESRNADIGFAQVNDFAAVGGVIVVAGVTRDSRGVAHPLHALDANLRWQRSFGELPATSDYSRLAEFGVGTLERTASGSLLFAPKSNQAMVELDTLGRVIARFSRRESRVTRPESAFVTDLLANGGKRVRTRPGVVVPTRAFPIVSGTVLYGFATDGKHTYTVATSRGFEPVALFEKSGNSVVMAIDLSTCRLVYREGGAKARQVWLAKLEIARELLRPTPNRRQTCAESGHLH
jgi:hypothetical protein